MTEHAMRLSAIPFTKIANGSKVIESRLLDEKRQNIAIGDTIKFSTNDSAEAIHVRVAQLHKHPTFAKLFASFPPAEFGGESKEALLEEIHQFYAPADEARYGVVGIRLELIRK